MNNEDFEEMKKREGFITKERKKKPDPRTKLKQETSENEDQRFSQQLCQEDLMNTVERDPVDYSPFEEKEDTSESLNGVEIPSLLNSIFYMFSIINTMMMLIIASMSIIFEDAMTS